MRINKLLRDSAIKIQAQTGVGSARIDAELLLLKVLDKPRSFLYANPEFELGPEHADSFTSLLDRRLAGEPVAYILGEKEFWSLKFEVNSNVLIPRPDTECLVEYILDMGLDTHAVIVDLGVGSGAISVALAHEKPNWRVYGVEYSEPALIVAQKNARCLFTSSAQQQPLFIRADWLQCFAGSSFDLVVANPPYIDSGNAHLQQGDVRFEPRSALVSECEGMSDIQAIAIQAKQSLKPGGWLVLEHGFDQAEKVASLLLSLEYAGVESFKDYAGNNRFTVARAGKCRP